MPQFASWLFICGRGGFSPPAPGLEGYAVFPGQRWFSNRTGTSVDDGVRKLNQTTGLTNGWAANCAPEVEFSPFRALSRRQMTFPSAYWIKHTVTRLSISLTLLFFGHFNFSKNITQTAVTNMMKQHMFQKTKILKTYALRSSMIWYSYYLTHLFL